MIYMFKALYYCQLMYLRAFGIGVLKHMNIIVPVFLLRQDQHGKQPLKRPKQKFGLMADIDILLMVQKRIRGGICHAIHQYANAKNN